MPCIILVNPFLDSNVGSVARAMLNFGLTELRVVDPICDIHSPNAKALAAGAVDVLENAKVFQTAEACVQDLNRVFATTIRPRGMTQLVYSPEVASKVIAESLHNCTTGIMFGRERSGLTNEEVALADGIIAIPSVSHSLFSDLTSSRPKLVQFKHFSSLNLAQAVNIVSYEIFKQASLDKAVGVPDVWLHASSGERLGNPLTLQHRRSLLLQLIARMLGIFRGESRSP